MPLIVLAIAEVDTVKKVVATVFSSVAVRYIPSISNLKAFVIIESSM